MARNTGRHIAHFAAGGYAAPSTTQALPTAAPGGAYAQGMPAATAAGGYTPGPETNVAGSWGAGAQSSGISGDTNTSPVGAPDTSAFNQPGNYVTPAAALPAAAANTAGYSNTGTPAALSIGGGNVNTAGGYNSNSELPYGGNIDSGGTFKDGGTVQNMKRGGKVRQMTPNGKPGSSQPTNEPPQFPQPQAPQAPRAPQAPSGIPAGPTPAAPESFYGGGMAGSGGMAGRAARQMPQPPVQTPETQQDIANGPGGDGSVSDMTKAQPGEVVLNDGNSPGGAEFASKGSKGGGGKSKGGSNSSGSSEMGMDDGGEVPDTGDAPIDADQGQEGQAGDPSQQSGPSPAVQSALTAARAQFGLNDNMFDMMSKQTAGNVQVAGGATPQTPSQQHPTQQHPTQQGGGGFPDNQTKGTLDRLKQLPGLENQINSGPQRGATPQTPSQQSGIPQESDDAAA